jgi:hypothetical protein
MKKSNKLLFGGFLFAVLLLSTLHLSLWAKYRSGDYVAYHPEDDLQSMVMQSFPHVKFVSVRHVGNLEVRFSDSAGVEKLEHDAIRYSQRGDTLLISGSDSVGGRKYYGAVGMRLPRNASLQAFKSAIYFTGGKGAQIGSPVLFLDESTARFDVARLGGLSITAINKSSVELAGAEIDSLQLQLQNSSLEDTNGNVGQLSISTDSLSRIALQAKHFSKVKTSPPAHE